MTPNLYVHFPFCRSKCSYCALHSRAGSTRETRTAYVAHLADAVRAHSELSGRLETIYFGGGSPALCELEPLFEVLKPRMDSGTEFTVELHPLDVTRELLERLRRGGVNRISMGVQSVDDAMLSDMGRGYAFAEAESAFRLVKETFDNAGIDLIIGYPGETVALTPRHARLAKWGLRHCSAYSLQLEPGTVLQRRLLDKTLSRRRLPTDDEVLNRLAVIAAFLSDHGLKRYEISNYAVPGSECRHNLAVWRGEDYVGLGEGASGRIGLVRTTGRYHAERGHSVVSESLTPARDLRERTIFRLRTSEGLETEKFPDWRRPLDGFVDEGLLTNEGSVYFLTDRGREVCDSILESLV